MRTKTVTFDALIERYSENGEKTGWTFIEIPADVATKLKPGNRRSFRVKGLLDNYQIKQTALIPVGGAKFIMPINSIIRKNIGKRHGAIVQVEISVDTSEIPFDQDLTDCLNDDKVAMDTFMKFTPSHRSYFSKWISSAKTSTTKTKRIVLTLEALAKGWDYGKMLRSNRKNI